MKNFKIEVIKKSLFNYVFDGYCNDELNNMYGDFDSKFNSVVELKEDIDGWGVGYYVCVDKNNDVIFNDVSICEFDNNDCVNVDKGIYFNIKKNI